MSPPRKRRGRREASCAASGTPAASDGAVAGDGLCRRGSRRLDSKPSHTDDAACLDIAAPEALARLCSLRIAIIG